MSLEELDPRRDMLDRLRTVMQRYGVRPLLAQRLVRICNDLLQSALPTDHELRVRGLIYEIIRTEVVGVLSLRGKNQRPFTRQSRQIVAVVRCRKPPMWSSFFEDATLAGRADPKMTAAQYRTTAALLLLLREAWLPIPRH